MSRERAIASAILLTASLLTGCLGSTGDDATLSAQGAIAGNLWETGLVDSYASPDVVTLRPSAERRSDVSPPGSSEFAALDNAIQQFMEDNGIPAASVAVMRDGKLRYENGYGHADAEGAVAADNRTMFRIASVTKPMTAALIAMQVQQGLYNWTDPVFCIPPAPAPNCRLHIDPHPARPIADERLGDIQVQHLIAHMGGWDRDISGEPFWSGKPIEIAADLGIPTPPPAWRIAQYMMGWPLDHAPGTTYAYCNVCYMLAGLVAEAATGATLPALYEAYLFGPLEVSGEIELGHALPPLRNPRDVDYPCEGGQRPSVYDPNDMVCYADGGFDLESVLGAGGLIATAAAVAAVYEVYGVDGSVRGDGPGYGGHNGGLPGTATIARTLQDGGAAVHEVQFVVLFNARESTHPVTGPYHFEFPFLAFSAAWAATENARVMPADAFVQPLPEAPWIPGRFAAKDTDHVLTGHSFWAPFPWDLAALPPVP